MTFDEELKMRESLHKIGFDQRGKLSKLYLTRNRLKNLHPDKYTTITKRSKL